MRLHYTRRSVSAAVAAVASALRPGELRYEFHTEPDKSTRDDRRTSDDRCGHPNHFVDDRGL